MSYTTKNQRIDFSAIAATYAKQRNPQTFGQIGSNVTNVKLNLVKLSAFDVHWNPSNMKTTTSEKQIRRSTHKTDDNDELNTEVGIKQGLCTGLSGLASRLNLPYPSPLEASHTLTLDACEPDFKEPITTCAELTSSSGSETAAGIEVSQKTTYKGTFSCNVYPKGKVLVEGFRGGKRSFDQIDTQTVIEHLKDQGHPAVSNFRPDREGRYYFEMSGEAELPTGTQVHHNWY